MRKENLSLFLKKRRLFSLRKEAETIAIAAGFIFSGMKKLTVVLKGRKKEGFVEPQFSLTATKITMPGSPSQSQEVNPQPLEGGEEQEDDLSKTLESPNSAVESDALKAPQPDPDHGMVTNQQEEEDAEEDRDNSGMSALTSAAPSQGPIASDVLLVYSSSHHPVKRGSKRKKGKGINSKKLQAIEKKKQTLLEKLNPVAFIPSKNLDFLKHEKLLKRLGLWDFVHVEFDRNNIRVDLIAQLIATYDPKLRCSYVNDFRIPVNRADLGRALKLPVKKEKSCNVIVDGVDLDSETLPEESVAFLDDFVSTWVLLHEDTWMTPVEVLNSTKPIKDRHPEKVDWAGLFWFMVEKELAKGEQLTDCFYASHLQCLIKSQGDKVLRPEVDEVVLKKEPEKVHLGEELVNVDLDKELKEEDGVGGVDHFRTGTGGEVQKEEDGTLPGPNVELTLGQDAQENDMKETEMVDVDESMEDDEEQQQQHWLHEKNEGSQHFMQRCIVEKHKGLDSLKDGKEEDDEVQVEEVEEGDDKDGFDIIPGEYAVGGEGMTGNFLQAMETTQIAFGSQGQLHDQSSVDLLASRNELQHMAVSSPSFYVHNGKREIVHDHEVSHHSLNTSNKRLRIDGPWNHRPSDLVACFDQMQQLLENARMIYEEKKQILVDSNVQKEIIVNELQKRDALIDHMHKIKCDEIHKRDAEIFRLRRELFFMGNLVEEYRNALKESDKAFAEYRQQHQLTEEPIYEDAGPGGVMMTTGEIEKQRSQQEEYRNNCSMFEKMVKETEKAFEAQFGEYLDNVTCLEKRFEVILRDFEVLRDSSMKSKVSLMEEKVSEASECPKLNGVQT